MKFMTWKGADWSEIMNEEVRMLDGMIEYLLERGVRVTGVLMPITSWHHELPYPSAFLEHVSSLCAKRSVRLLDLSKTLSDEEFADQMHLNRMGTRKFQAAMRELAGDHLQEIAASPQTIDGPENSN